MALNNRTFDRNATKFSRLKVALRKIKGDTADFGDYAGLPMHVIQLPPGQTGAAFEVWDSTGAVIYQVSSAGAKAGIEPMRVAHARYNFAVDGGAIAAITPAAGAIIPANALVIGGIINVTTAVLAAGGAANVSIGTSAGSSATSILGATAKATFSLAAVLDIVPVFTAVTAFKMSAAGSIIITPDTHALTAGVFDVFVYYVVASA